MLVAAATLTAASIGFLSYKLYKRFTTMKVIQVDTTPLDHIKDEKMLEQLFELAAEAYGKLLDKG